MLAPFPYGGDPMRDGQPERAPHILTNSWGCPPFEGCDGRVLRSAVSALTGAGIFFVAAAGNNGPACGTITDEPAVYEDAFTVAAVDRERRPADFSSRGPVPGAAEPDIAAPGVDVLSAVPGGGYTALSGTSMAAPHVAGVVALLWSANPSLIGDVRRTSEILWSSTTEAVPPVPAPRECPDLSSAVGAGVVNAYAAVRSAG
jgi:subtilisin family serine protease